MFLFFYSLKRSSDFTFRRNNNTTLKLFDVRFLRKNNSREKKEKEKKGKRKNYATTTANLKQTATFQDKETSTYNRRGIKGGPTASTNNTIAQSYWPLDRRRHHRLQILRYAHTHIYTPIRCSQLSSQGTASSLIF